VPSAADQIRNSARRRRYALVKTRLPDLDGDYLHHAGPLRLIPKDDLERLLRLLAGGEEVHYPLKRAVVKASPKHGRYST
jgi:hypothetical protein